MAHVNTVTVQTAEGAVEVTKTSTHRDYVVASAYQREDGTQTVAAWHMTEKAGHDAIRSAAMTRTATRLGATPVLLPVTTTLTGRDAKVSEQEAGEIALEAAANLDAEIDAHNAKVAAKAETGTTGNTCRCGCGAAIGRKSTYRPGHDARHASIVAQDIASSAQPFFERVTADSDLGSQALIEKAHRQAEALLAKAAKKAK